MNQPISFRIRATYSKTGNLRFIGHLDLQRLWERTFRRAKLPMQFSQGFSPKVRLNLASALPLGITSHVELIDFWLTQSLALQTIHAALKNALPAELQVTALESVPLDLPSLQSSIQACEFKITLPNAINPADLQSSIETFLASGEILRNRRGKTYNLRPLVHCLSLEPAGGEFILCMTVNAREGATGRPDEVLDQLGLDPLACAIERTRLVF